MDCATNFDLNDLISRVKSDKVEVTISFEPDRTEISIQPWRPFGPMCPYAGAKNREDEQ